jgi:hypothetical protein
MKTKITLLSVCLCLVGFAAVAAPSESDQKWLNTVQNMVSQGKTKVSTPSEARVALMKEWGAKHGYSAKVTKNDQSFVIELTPAKSASVAQN